MLFNALLIAVVLCLCAGQEFPAFPDGPMMQSCESFQCPPTSTCVQRATFISCECPYGKTGMTCEVDDPCLPKVSGCPKGTQCFGECNPNVVCNGATGIPQCAGCVVGWTGKDCRTDLNECTETPDICLNGGTCVNLAGDYTCTCPTGWTGKDCFCKKRTECDVADVKNMDQYSNRTDTIIYPQFPTTTDKGDNSAQYLQLNTNLILILSMVAAMLQ